MNARTAQRTQTTRAPEIPHLGRLRLWYGFLGAPVIWSVYFLVAYVAVALSCNAGNKIALYVLAIVAFLATAGTVVVSALNLRALPQSTPANMPERARNTLARERFMARFGLYTGLFFTAAVVATVIPIIVLNPCQSHILEGTPIIWRGGWSL